MPVHFLPGRLNQPGLKAGQTPANSNLSDVQNAHQIGHSDAQVAAHCRHRLLHVGVAGGKCLQNHVRIHLCRRCGKLMQQRLRVALHKFFSLADEQPAVDHRFQTTGVAATARLAVFHHANVANFARAVAIPVKKLALNHNPGANAAPHFNHHQAGYWLAPAKGKLTERGHLAVVGNVHRHAVALSQQITQRQILPIQIDGLAHHSGFGVHQAGGANANPQNGTGGGGG